MDFVEIAVESLTFKLDADDLIESSAREVRELGETDSGDELNRHKPWNVGVVFRK